jgi:hypothetical protein
MGCEGVYAGGFCISLYSKVVLLFQARQKIGGQKGDKNFNTQASHEIARWDS